MKQLQAYTFVNWAGNTVIWVAGVILCTCTWAAAYGICAAAIKIMAQWSWWLTKQHSHVNLYVKMHFYLDSGKKKASTHGIYVDFRCILIFDFILKHHFYCFFVDMHYLLFFLLMPFLLSFWFYLVTFSSRALLLHAQVQV